jgi:HPt (histidine-containing phosphotransfer) domain-containing protein
MDELYAKFLPQFLSLARERTQRAREVAGPRDAASLTTAMRELHAIAGEAGLLGLAAIVPLARAAEEHAKLLRDAEATGDGAAFEAALDELARSIEALGASTTKT